MRPVRLLATASILALGLFTLKAIEFGVDTADAWAARSEDPPAEAHDESVDDTVSPLAATSLDAPVCETPDDAGQAQSSLSLRLANRGLSPSEQRILRSLTERRTELDARERELDTREQLLEAAEIRVDERIDELRGLQADIDTLLGTLSEQEEAEIQRLVAFYNNMEVENAAERIAALEPDIQVQIMTRLAARKAGEIMGAMEVPDAARLTSLIAARRDVPETAAELEAQLGTEG